MRDDYERLLTTLHRAMIEFDFDDPKRIQHFAKVHSYAKLIGQLEGLDEKTLFNLEVAAYTHDIGIHVAEEKFGYQNGKLQEELGPAAVRTLLNRLGVPEDVTKRVTWLIAHHHTYTDISAIDYQILVEADMLVNTFEDAESFANRTGEKMRETAKNVRDKYFATRAGTSILNDMFGLDN